MSIRTSKADHNLLSCSANVWQLYSGTDHPESASLAALTLLTPDDRTQWDAILKVCDGTTGLNLPYLRVAQGNENVIDCNNRVSDCHFEGEIGLGGGSGDQVITVKGGCHDLSFKGTVWSRGRNASVVVGAYSDQCFDISHDLDFSSLSHISGDPLTFILARCDRRTIKLPPGAKVLFWKSAAYSAYWWAKWVAVKVGLFR